MPALLPDVAASTCMSGSFRLVDEALVSYPMAWRTEVAAFVADVIADGGPRLRLGGDRGHAAIRLQPASVDDLDGPRAHGQRADGVATVDERYRLTIDADGVRIASATAEGAHRGLTTLRQLIVAASEGADVILEAGDIHDGPRFAWRGLSLDVARTFHEVRTICRVIDMMSLYRLNVLHLHLTDDQGWRFEVPDWPLLHEIGGAGAMHDRPGGYYSRADLREIVSYARSRHVVVVPELDMPGHTGAVVRAYPALALAGTAAPALDPANPDVWSFVDAAVGALAAAFDTSARIHIGGDEAFGMPDDAYGDFVARAQASVARHGRLAVCWQEGTRAGVSADTIVQWWIDPDTVAAMESSPALQAMLDPAMLTVVREVFAKADGDLDRARRAGAQVLLSPASALYLDRPHAEPSIDVAQEARRPHLGLPVYPGTALASYAEADVDRLTPGLDLDRDVAGVEAAVWCETVETAEDLEVLLLPRLAAVGQAAWSGPDEWSRHAGVLAVHSRLWDARGWSWFKAESVRWPQPALATRAP